MKVSRTLVGKEVRIQWMDPGTFNTTDGKRLVGRAAMATWIERGILADVTDGVLIIDHSVGVPADGTEPDEWRSTAVHEALVEKLVVLTEAAGAPLEKEP